jgi:selenide, water dikinase
MVESWQAGGRRLNHRSICSADVQTARAVRTVVNRSASTLSGLASVPLTSLSHGAGCGCKLGPGDLLPILAQLRIPSDPRILVGTASGDDGAVFQLGDDLAIVQTVDFFTPIVDDPFDFGRIAAANALSDVYAMGGQPLMALNLVAFPLQQLGADILRLILEGGRSVAAEAGCAIVGGHSIYDPEPKYGLAVTGTVDPSAILTNAGARAGDVLVLSKPLGVGAVTTARKRGVIAASEIAAAVDTMVALNAEAGRQALDAGAHAATDVTGFGLLGHLHGLARESGLAAEVRADDVPALPIALDLLGDGEGVSGGGRRNLDYAAAFTTFGDHVSESRRRLLCDPTTSGGLLVSLPGDRAGHVDGFVIGRMLEGEAGAIRVL